MFLWVAIAIWLVAVLAWWICSKMFRQADLDRLKNRLLGTTKTKKAKSSKDAPALIQTEVQAGVIVTRMMKRFQMQTRLQDLLEQAGLKWHASRLIHISMGLFIGGFVIGWIVIPADLRKFAIVPALIASALPALYVTRKKKARLRRFEELFPDSLEFVARSMRAGHAFSVSLEMIHREFQEPLSGEFRRTFEEHNLGLPLDMSLQKLAKRVPSLDVHFFVSAVLLQKRTGGNLAEILDKLAYVIRERFKLRGRIRAVSAHGRMTGLALTCIPIGVAVIMFYVNPDYMHFFLYDDVGRIMLGSAVLLQVIGYMVIKQIVKIEV
ncbi:MAG: type II secretion system F family protein [Bryobacteraceae bacterium]